MKIVVVLSLLALTACATPSAPYPPASDVNAIVVPRPKTPPEALTDPAVDARHRSTERKWGDDIHAAGVRVCEFLASTGMRGIDCG